MRRSAQLGGDAPGHAVPGMSMAMAHVHSRYQDEQTRQWFMVVRLDGGRMLRGVQVLSQGDGAASGSSGRLPAVGASGVVCFPSFPRSTQQVFWLGSFDGFFHGVDVHDAEASVSMHPSGAATALDERGAQTTRYPGGDLLYIGPEGEDPHAFSVRARDYAETQRLQKLDELDEGLSLPPLELLLSGWRKLRRIGATLFKGRGELTVDTGSGRAAVRAEVHQDQRWTRAQFAGMAGQSLRAEVSSSEDEDAGVRAALIGKGARADLRAHGQETHAAVELRDDRANIDAELTRIGRPDVDFAHLASAPPTQENFDAVVKALKLLKDRADRTDVRMQLIARLWPPLAPILGIPLGFSARLKLEDVASPNVQAQKGGS